MCATEVPFGQQTIVRSTEQTQIFERRGPTKSVRQFMMQLQESATRAAPPLVIYIRALPTVPKRDRSPHLI
jgi:hypothetical protein